MSDKQRATFEKWLQGGYNKDWLVSCNGYADPTVDRMWLSWQAAIESVVVELPKGDGDETGWLVSLTEVEDALDAAGVKYK